MSSRRTKGEGSISKRGDGRWTGRYYAKMPTGKVKRQAVYGRTRAEALAKMRKEQAQAVDGSPIIHNGVKLEQYLSQWIESPVNQIADTTRCLYRSIIKRHLIPTIGNLTLSSLTTANVQHMINLHLHNGCSNKLVRDMRNILSAALRDAICQGLVSKNVARDAQVPPYKPDKKPIWNKSQTQIFLKTAKSNKLYPAFELLIQYGLRRGEVLGLQWSNIDFENNLIRIRRQVTYAGSELVDRELKTDKSKRDLVMTLHIRESLLKLDNQKCQEGYVFMHSKQEQVKPSHLTWAYKKICKEAGLPQIRIHDLRHMAATFMADGGVSQKDVMAILGHSSATTTLEHYQHSTLKNQATALNIYANFLTN